jgi:outer membrane biosynthesis protein TonB
MRAVHRIVLLLGLTALVAPLAACSNFDPDKLDIFGLNEKKKLPGERKELFPGGVPGVTQGIPPEYMKGNQPPPDTAQTPVPQQGNQSTAGEAEKTAAVEPEPKPKPKPKPKPRTVSQPPAQITVQPAPQGAVQQQQPSPWPQPASEQATTAPWPSTSPTAR